ncbi:hypothetical protein OAG68_00305 [bacterium]|nr:hypothetical protein [bacterium]
MNSSKTTPAEHWRNDILWKGNLRSDEEWHQEFRRLWDSLEQERLSAIEKFSYAAGLVTFGEIDAASRVLKWMPKQETGEPRKRWRVIALVLSDLLPLPSIR